MTLNTINLTLTSVFLFKLIERILPTWSQTFLIIKSLLAPFHLHSLSQHTNKEQRLIASVSGTSSGAMFLSVERRVDAKGVISIHK